MRERPRGVRRELDPGATGRAARGARDRDGPAGPVGRGVPARRRRARRRTDDRPHPADPGRGRAARPVMQVPGVDTNAGEGGLLGLAVSPAYARDQHVYAYFTSAQDNRIVRFRLGGAAAADPHWPGPQRDPRRRADRLRPRRHALRRDRRRRATARSPRTARPERQDPAHAARTAGPATTTRSGLARLVVRPPQRPGAGLGRRRAGCGRPSSARTRFDEVNLIRTGRNYGWPRVEGRGGTTAAVHEPARHLADVAGLAERRGDRRRRALRRRAARRAAVAGPARTARAPARRSAPRRALRAAAHGGARARTARCG